MRLFTRGADERDGDFARSAAEIRRFARAYERQNVYIAPNPTCQTGGSRHSAADVTHWSYFLIDMDPVEKEYDALAAAREALLWLGEWNGKPVDDAIIIDSGRGCQAWVRLEDVVLDDVTPGLGVHSVGKDDTTRAVSRSVARRVNGYWLKRLDEHLGVVHGCRVDTSVSDLPRVMRCPGTINAKTGRPARFVQATSKQFVGLATIMSALPKKYLTDPIAPEGVASGQPWQMVFSHLTRTAQEYLLRGQEEPGRHKVMWHTAKKLFELGVTRDEARRALRRANKLRGRDHALDADQVEHALNTAYGS